MVHVQSVNYTSRKYHTRMCKEVGEWKYPVICSIRKGWFRPYHAQVFIDDWRIPEIITDQFVADMHFKDPGTWAGDGNKKGFMKTSSKLIKLIVYLMRKIGPWNNKTYGGVKPRYGSSGWKYNLLLGVVDDPIQRTKHDGKYKEVL